MSKETEPVIKKKNKTKTPNAENTQTKQVHWRIYQTFKFKGELAPTPLKLLWNTKEKEYFQTHTMKLALLWY